LTKKAILENYWWGQNGRAVILDSAKPENRRQFFYPILPGWVCHPKYPDKRIPVRMLVDTGTDITVFRPNLIGELEERLPVLLAPLGIIQHGLGKEGNPSPIYDLELRLENGHRFKINNKIAAASKTLHFDVADVWLGQDVLSNYSLEINGPAKTLSLYVME